MIKVIKLQLPVDRKRLTHFLDYSAEECLEADRPRFGEGPISRPDDMAALIAFHWGKLWTKRRGAPSRDRVERYLRSYDSRVPVGLLPTMPCREGDGVHSATEDTWEDLVVKAIKHSNNSCAGPDGVPFIVYRSLAELAAPFILDMLIALANGETPPLDFNLGRLFLLPKGDTHKVLDNRPITVNNADNRLIATVVTAAISPATQALVHVSQKGFVSGRRGSDNVTGITDLFYNRLEAGEELHVLQVDTKKAFDSIDHDFIKAVLSHVGFPLWLVLVVQALFANASVVPVLSAHTSTRVPIRRGVKQGCPLSPTLFVIIYDPLICEIADLDSGTYPVSPFAFADDLAVAVPNIRLVVTVIVLIAAFALISGLGVNDDKSRLLSTIPLDDGQLEVIRSSPWPGLLQVESLTYLGIVFGIGVTVEHVFARPLAKLADRAALYGYVLRRLSLHLRVVAVNVFLLSLFSYHIGFYYPLTVIDQIHRIIRPLLVPFSGTAFKLGHLVLGPGLGAFGLISPLKDIWAWSVAMLANKFDLSALHGLHRDGVDVLDDVRPRSLSSMVTGDHIRACANEVLQFAVTDGGICDTANFILNTQEGRLNIYKRITARAWRPRTDVLDGKRLGSMVNRMTRWGCGTTEAADALSRRWCSGDVFATPRAIAHHFSLVFNAVPTNRRVAAFGEAYTNGMVTHCYFCGSSDPRYYNDSIEHIYAGCVVVKRARDRFLGCFDITFPFDLPHSLLAHTGPDPLPKPLRRNLFSAIVLFNLTVWAVRWRIFVPALHPPPQDVAVNLVCSAVVTDWNNFTRRTPALSRFLVLLDTGKVAPGAHAAVAGGGGRGRKRKSRSCEEALQLIQAPPPGSLFLFSDGGAKPNPGPCGAGLAAYMDSEWVVSLSAGLGRGTNNLGEIFAFGMALDVGLLRAAVAAPGQVRTFYIISDSTLAIGVITEGHTLKALPTDPIYQLVQLARGKLRSLKRLVTVRSLWVASHSGIEGNERADQNASAGVELSARDPSDRSVVERAIASKSFLFQPP
jgi:ribonuclease HI